MKMGYWYRPMRGFRYSDFHLLELDVTLRSRYSPW